MSALFIAISKVTDRDKINQYLAGAPASLAGHEVGVEVFSEDAETIEGAPPGSRVVILKFPSKEAAMAWYNSEGYQQVLPLRLAGSEGFSLLVDTMS